MGAQPLAVLDGIVCGRLEGASSTRLVAGMAGACARRRRSLVGSETSDQPGVVQPGIYVLSASTVGVAERGWGCNGSKIRPGDAVLAVASNGLHTNGYRSCAGCSSGARSWPRQVVDGETFLVSVVRPHTCYYWPAESLFGRPDLHGLAHITGGGIQDNVIRVLPRGRDARVGVGAIRVPDVFRVIRDEGGVSTPDMLRTFNLGCGLVVVSAPDEAADIAAHFARRGHDCRQVGHVTKGVGEVRLDGDLAL